MKAEFLYQYYQDNSRPLSNWVFGHFSTFAKIAAPIAPLVNFANRTPFIGSLMKYLLGVSPKRNLPQFNWQTLKQWHRKYQAKLTPSLPSKGKVYFFCDEFTKFNDALIGQKAILLLITLGYEVDIRNHADSGRTHISKGFLTEAQQFATENVATFAPLVSEQSPLVGLEPSAIHSFRDEYPRLVKGVEMIKQAKQLAQHTMTIEAFISREILAGHIDETVFKDEPKQILLHGHCHQKALDTIQNSAMALSLPKNYEVEVIPSGCCGMAGSFGYEKDHYELSMQVGELVLFPAVRAASEDILIAAPGTSCRHQISDGTQKKAFHPVEILLDALKNPIHV